jgi:hypothetical protein
MKPLPVPTTPDEIAQLLHEAVVYGSVFDLTRFGAQPPAPLFALVVGRRRPHLPCGADPRDVNRECARRFAVWRHEPTTLADDEWRIVEIDAAACVPFVDRAAELAAADERANAAQRNNVKPAKGEE